MPQMTKKSRDAMQRHADAMAAYEAAAPETISELALLTAERLIATSRLLGRAVQWFSINHDARNHPDAFSKDMKSLYRNDPDRLAEEQRRAGPCSLPIDWRRKNMCGIKTADDSDAREWISRALMLGYHVYYCSSDGNGVGRGTLKQIRSDLVKIRERALAA